MKFTGTITAALPESAGVSATGKQWRRRDYVLLYEGAGTQYPKSLLFSVLGDNIDKLALVQGGEYEVEVDFSTREYNGKMFMSANAWKATPLGSSQTTPAAYPQPAGYAQPGGIQAPPPYQQVYQPAPPKASVAMAPGADDLPF